MTDCPGAWHPGPEPVSQVRLSCGHTGTIPGRPKPGTWVSCWAAVITGGGTIRGACQAQRKIITVQEPL